MQMVHKPGASRTTEHRTRTRRRPRRLVGVDRHSPCEVLTETDTRYMDADGDGMLDAVEIVISLVAVGPESRRVLSTTRLVLAGVGDDGVPHDVAVRSAA